MNAWFFVSMLCFAGAGYMKVGWFAVFLVVGVFAAVAGLCAAGSSAWDWLDTDE